MISLLISSQQEMVTGDAGLRSSTTTSHRRRKRQPWLTKDVVKVILANDSFEITNEAQEELELYFERFLQTLSSELVRQQSQIEKQQHHDDDNKKNSTRSIGGTNGTTRHRVQILHVKQALEVLGLEEVATQSIKIIETKPRQQQCNNSTEKVHSVVKGSKKLKRKAAHWSEGDLAEQERLFALSKEKLLNGRNSEPSADIY